MLSLAYIIVSQLSINYLTASSLFVLLRDAHDKMFDNNYDDDYYYYDDDNNDDNLDDDGYDGDDFDMSFKKNISIDDDNHDL